MYLIKFQWGVPCSQSNSPLSFSKLEQERQDDDREGASLREIDSRISFGDDSLLAETGENAEGGYDDLAGVNFEGGEALGHFAEPRRRHPRARLCRERGLSDAHHVCMQRSCHHHRAGRPFVCW